MDGGRIPNDFFFTLGCSHIMIHIFLSLVPSLSKMVLSISLHLPHPDFGFSIYLFHLSFSRFPFQFNFFNLLSTTPLYRYLHNDAVFLPRECLLSKAWLWNSPAKQMWRDVGRYFQRDLALSAAIFPFLGDYAQISRFLGDSAQTFRFLANSALIFRLSAVFPLSIRQKTLLPISLVSLLSQFSPQ